MKNLILVLPLLLASPSCKAIDGMLGVGGSADKSEETIQAGEQAVSGIGNAIIPGAGGALAVVFGMLARSYVKRRKASTTVAV